MSAPDRPQVQARTDWRPQQFGRRNAKKIVNPLIEPLWDGIRVLARVESAGAVSILDEDGEPLADEVDTGAEADLGRAADPADARGVAPAVDVRSIGLALRAALVGAESATIDGYLSSQPTRTGEGIRVDAPQIMSASDLATHFLVGGMARSEVRRKVEEENALDSRDLAVGESPLAFVAVDLLELDGESVLDVPLLERKRLLASILAESALVRLTPFVRPPVDTWLLSWRAAGFRSLAYKAANSRYEPGERSDDWARITIPLR